MAQELIEDIRLKKQIEDIFQLSIKNGYSIAFWSKPNTTDWCLCMSQKCQEIDTPHQLLNLKGFYVQAFSDTDKNAFIPDDFFVDSSDESIHKKLEERISIIQELPTPTKNKKKPLPSTTTASDYKSQVNLAKETIERGVFDKVVISKVLTQTLPADFSLVEAFIKVTVTSPATLRYIFHTPHTGTWIGATPEVLAQVDKEETFKTVALAGTQPFTGQKLKDALWRQKEIEEQAFVSKYIINCFKKIRLREYEDFGPKTVRAGNLLHLQTAFRVKYIEVNYPELPAVMLGLLHPTSAIAGIPKEPAIAFILRHEQHQRTYYSGFLGPVNIHHETDLFVNLRCAQLYDNQIILYAGAGITEDSCADEEWLETELKLKTIKQILL